MSIIIFWLSVLISWLIGLAFVRKFRKIRLPELAAAMPFGLGITGFLYFAWFLIFDKYWHLYIILEALLALVSFFYLKKNNVNLFFLEEKNIKGSRVDEQFLPTRILIIMVLVFMLLLLAENILLSKFHGLGSWDALAIWNYKAAFLYKGGEHWTNMFSDVLRDLDHHKDYPLMLPSIVARGWVYTGFSDPLVPRLISKIFAYFCVLVLYFGVSSLKQSRIAGLLAIIVAAIPQTFNLLAESQCADLPLALYVLLAIYYLLSWHDSGEQGELFLAFFAAACGMWMKNEGIAFAGIFAIFVFLLSRLGKEKIQPFSIVKTAFIAYLPALTAVLILKYFQQTSNDLLDNISVFIFRVIDFDTIRLIISYMVQALFIGLPWFWFFFFYLLFRPVKAKEKISRCFLGLLIAQVTTYVLAYLLTPYDLHWHLGASFPRIYAHIHYAFIMVFFVFAYNPFSSTEKGAIMQENNTYDTKGVSDD